MVCNIAGVGRGGGGAQTVSYRICLLEVFVFVVVFCFFSLIRYIIAHRYGSHKELTFNAR